MYWSLKKISCKACLLFYFLVTYSSLDLYFHPIIIKFFWFAQLQFRIEEKIHTKGLELLGERFFCFPGRDRKLVSSRKLLCLVKLYQWIWNYEIYIKFNHSFTNRGSFHCAILKALQDFKEKELCKKGKTYAIFLSKFSK